MIILFNAKIHSPGTPFITASAIENGYFLACGTDDEILGEFSGKGQVINLQGRSIFPGLYDSHVHLFHLAESMAMINCETSTLEECLTRVKSGADQLTQGAWVRGHGWNQNIWQSGYGTAELLEKVCADCPAYLTAKSLHAAWVNKKALTLAGITSNTVDPPGGVIDRDDKGQPTGILFEAGAMSLVESIIPKPSEDEIITKLNLLFPELWKLGLVGVHDFDGVDCWEALQTLHQNKALNFRICKSIPSDHLDAFIQARFYTDAGDNWLHLGGVKLFADGALGPQTAAMHQPYQNTNVLGNLLLTENEIFEIGKKAVNNGIALSVHAIGDRANSETINALEKLRCYENTNNLPNYHHRIEHVQIIEPEDIKRMARLNIIASVQPIHATSDMEMSEKFLGQRSKNAYAYKTMLDHHLQVIFGSDAPVETVNPFVGIHASVTRRRGDGTPGPDGWYPAQRLSLSEAIDGFSSTPCEVTNRGSCLGRILPGYKADFLIIEEDPFLLVPDDLKFLKPAATFIEGKCTYQSPSLALELDHSEDG